MKRHIHLLVGVGIGVHLMNAPISLGQTREQQTEIQAARNKVEALLEEANKLQEQGRLEKAQADRHQAEDLKVKIEKHLASREGNWP